jgi:hypothetical protein
MLKNKKATIKDYPGKHLSNSNFIHEQRISKQSNKSCYFRLTVEVRFYDFEFCRRKTLSPRIYEVFTHLARNNRVTARCRSLVRAISGAVILMPLVETDNTVEGKAIRVTGRAGP